MHTFKRPFKFPRTLLRGGIGALLAVVMALASIEAAFASTITSGTPPQATYGVAYTFTFTGTGTDSWGVSSGALPTGLSLNATTGVLSGTPTAVPNTYTFVVRAFGPGTDATQTVNLVVNKKALTVTGDAKSKTYGDANPTFTYTATGLATGDTTATVLSGAPTTTADATSVPNTYSITQGTVALTTYGTARYNLTYTAGTLTVNKKALTVAADAKSKTYGDANPVFTVTPTGLVNSDTAATVLTGTPTTTADATSVPGTYSITQGTVALTTYGNARYTMTFNAGTLTVNKKALTVAADAKSKTYGDANPALTVTPTGLVNSDTAATVLTGTPATTAITSSAAGTYPITQGSVALTTYGNARYTMTFTASTLTVNKAALTVTPTAQSKTYGDANPTLSYTTSGLVNGDTAATVLSGALATTATTGSPVGTYPITQGTLVSNSNYTLTVTAGVLLTVNKAVLTVTANDQTKIYGDSNPTLTYGVSGLVNGDDDGDVLTGNLATTATATSPVGGYPITQGTLVSNGNYTLTFVPATLSVDPADLTVTADAKSKTYGDANPALTYTVSGLVNGESADNVLSGALTTTATTASPVGSYPITQGTLAANSNYSLAFTSASLTVNPATLTVTADDKTRIYGAANPALTYAVSGLVNSDTANDVLSGALTTAATTTSPVGSYPITQGTLATNGNYSLSFTAGNLAVTAAALTVTADDQSRSYGDLNPTFTYGVSGLVNSDTAASVLSGALSTGATASSAVGTYPITQGTLAANANYNLTVVDGTLTVTTAPLTVTANDATRKVGTANPAFTASYSGFVNGEDDSVLGGTLTFSTPATIGSPVGTYAITPSGLTSSNYTISFANGTLTVTDKDVPVITWDTPASIVYGTALSSTQLGATASFNGNPVAGSFSYTPAAGEVLGAGANQTLTVQFTPSDTDTYASTTGNTTITVTPAALTVTADDKSRSYGVANPVFTYSVSGLVNNDTAAAVLSGNLGTTATAGSAVGSYPISQGTLAANGNYDLTVVDGTLTVTKAALTVRANDASRKINTANPVFTASYTGFVNGEDDSVLGGTLTFSTPATISSPAGTYAITPSGLTSGNYTISFVNGTLTVTDKDTPVIIWSNPAAIVYGTALSATQLNATASFNSQPVAGTFSYTPAAGTVLGAGSHTLSVTFTPTDGSSFESVTTSRTIIVNKATLTVRADNKTRKVGAANPTFTYTVSGLVNGDTAATVLSGALTTSATTASPVGSYPITQGTLVSNSNYTISYVSGTLTVEAQGYKVYLPVVRGSTT